MTEVIPGSLDAYTRLDLESMSAAEAARQHFDGEIAAQVSPRSTSRIAIDHDDDVVGFVTPGHNHYHPVIGYLAVLHNTAGRATSTTSSTKAWPCSPRRGWTTFERRPT